MKGLKCMIKKTLNSQKLDLRVGVFICRCGGNISDIVDIDKLKSSIDADVVEEFENLCSLNGRKIIRDNIINKELDRVVIASCSPITHEKNFPRLYSAFKPIFNGHG